MDLIKNRNYFLSVSVVLIVLALAAIAAFGFKQGIDLKGGTQWNVLMGNSATSEVAVRDALAAVNPEYEVQVQSANDGSMLIRLPNITNDEHAAYASALSNLGTYTEKSFSTIGPTVGAELKTKAIWAIVLVLVGISLYVAWAFRKVSEPVKSWKYGVATLISLFHDVIIPAGMLALLGHFKGIEIDTNFIVALLVVMGFSVHDTIVVFDRIREHLLLQRGRKFLLADIVNQSVNETFVRSVNTSLTLVIVLVSLLLVGPSSLFYFVLTILVGTVVGTYSSIFIASPILYLWGRGKHA
jgi:preprotein translocase subunit SecF